MTRAKGVALPADWPSPIFHCKPATSRSLELSIERHVNKGACPSSPAKKLEPGKY
ncbi:UNVERIFIED_CONTAM: hypothetical protein Sradi_0708400 [Sesamum radiatum]|uniref:Uncharacterized protein n=1 Tax=Sesamum radiatum TaxID=300843 RepID=A0AAW2VM22_SESRA